MMVESPLATAWVSLASDEVIPHTQSMLRMSYLGPRVV